MALSNEDKKDVSGAMGKALANKIDSITRDNKRPFEHLSKLSKGALRKHPDIVGPTHYFKELGISDSHSQSHEAHRNDNYEHPLTKNEIGQQIHSVKRRIRYDRKHN